MTRDPLLQVVQSILSQPTAPFHEEAVRNEIARQLEPCPHVSVGRDSFGNLVAHYHRGSSPARFALAAHMDHPAYVGGEFLGGVPAAYLEKTPPLRDFGPFAMWDLPAFELRDGRIFSRACDDLIGCAVIVETLRELERTEAEVSLYGVFTRAEEVGFVGAIELAKSHVLPEDVTILSLECSSERGGGNCKMGAGAILRVGDRSSIFDPAVSAMLADAAKRSEIDIQRCLMSGGSCEATAYQLYGYRAGALCVALGNYHNCGPHHRIEPEFVAIDDVRSLVQLCVAIARYEEPLHAATDALRAKIEQRVAELLTRFS
jgi:endoglucanase